MSIGPKCWYLYGMSVCLAWIVLALASPPAYAQTCAPRVTPKVVGGKPAAISDWPGFSSIRLRHKDTNLSIHYCGGTVIAPSWVLSAAHCFIDVDEIWAITKKPYSADKVLIEFVVGVEDLEKPIPASAVYGISGKPIIHPVYAAEVLKAKQIVDPAKRQAAMEAIGPRVGHDLALARLAKPWQGAVSRLSLASATDSTETPPGGMPALGVVVAGFGATEAHGQDLTELTRTNGQHFYVNSPQLLEVTLPQVDVQTCRPNTPAQLADKIICAGHAKANPLRKDSCVGDSGGPLVFHRNDCPIQVGVVSYGPFPCAPQQDALGIYTRVSPFIPWIKGHTGELPAPPK